MTLLRRMTARVKAGAATLAATLLAAAVPVVGTPEAAALPAPLNPAAPAVAAEWVNPNIRPGETTGPVTLALETAPALDNGPLPAGEELIVTLSVRNTSSAPVSGLELGVRRSAPVGSVADARQALTVEETAYPWQGLSRLQEDALAPGESRTISLTVPTAPGAAGSLSIGEAGSYPVMFTLRGPDGSVTTERFLLAVSDPASDSAATPDAAPPLSLIYPLTAEVDILPGETGEAPQDPPLLLRSEQLAGQLTGGGRLDELLSAYEEAALGEAGSPELRQASCLAVDPALLSVVERMSRGYRVAAARPEFAAPQRLRDSWDREDEDAVSQVGTGAAAAGQWLERLQSAAAESCLLSLPWANTDLRAIAGSDNPALVNEAIGRGPSVLAEVLGDAGVTNAVIAPGGYIDAAVVTATDEADEADHTATTEDSASLAELHPVQMLVADNTVPMSTDAEAGSDPRFVELTPAVHAVRYQGSLAATLATVGEQPLTVGYSNPATRYDYRVDSAFSRSTTAAAALRLAVAEETRPAGTSGTGDAAAPVLAMLPATLDPEPAGRLLATAADLFAADQAEALALPDYLTPAGEPTTLAEGAEPGSPYPDPSAVTDTEILQASQQAGYLDDLTRLMVNDPVIALTRYGFTLPLRQELLIALSFTGRNSLGGYEDAVARTSRELNDNRDIIQELRGSVSLLPPGNVYTRASESSPLLLVAENRLPLPVEATIAYDTVAVDQAARLNVPGTVRIPASGSITVQMTADIPAEQDQTQLRLWLATADGAAISAPVDISVQTRTGTTALAVLVALLLVVLGLALLVRIGRKRHQKGADRPRAPAPEDSDH